MILYCAPMCLLTTMKRTFHTGALGRAILLSFVTGSPIHEHYTRECEFGNFDKNKKQKQHKKQNNTKKNFG